MVDYGSGHGSHSIGAAFVFQPGLRLPCLSRLGPLRASHAFGGPPCCAIGTLRVGSFRGLPWRATAPLLRNCLGQGGGLGSSCGAVELPPRHRRMFMPRAASRIARSRLRD